MKSRGIVLAVTAAFLVLATWLVLRPGPASAPAGKNPAALATPAVTQTGEVIPSTANLPGGTAGPATSATPAALAGQPGAKPVPPGTVTPAAATPATAAAAAAERDSAMIEVSKVRRMVVDYHTLMGENPIGTNAEIMHALMGGNARQATLGPPEGQTLNDRGELIDQWGTPYFFHQLSRDKMEVHSAGPDKILGTADDLVVK